MSGNLLTKSEVMTLLACIQNVPVTNTCPSLTENVMRRIRIKRRYPRDVKIVLSKKKKGSSKKSGEKKSKKKKDKDKGSSSCTGSCVADYVVRALSCLFD